MADGLRAASVGAYGNAWIGTPCMDRLASAGFLFDQALADTLDPLAVWDALQTGQHAAAPRSADGDSLPQALGAAGLPAILLCDDDRLLRRWQFAGIECLPALEITLAAPADDPLETHLAAFFAQAAERLEHWDGRGVFWLQTRALSTAWDAPYEYRQRYAEEDDPPPPAFVAPPAAAVAADVDPDELLGYAQAYAGQVALFDECLAGFLQALDGRPWRQQTAVTLLGSRGFPLGEHGWLGHASPLLFGEHVHLPWIVRFPDGMGQAGRSSALVQSCDLAPTLRDWLGLPPAPVAEGKSLLPLILEDAAMVRDRLLVCAGDRRAIRTADWYCCQSQLAPGGAGRDVALYAKPEDRWEVNDVADRCQDVADGLAQRLGELEAAIGAGRANDLPPLADSGF